MLPRFLSPFVKGKSFDIRAAGCIPRRLGAYCFESALLSPISSRSAEAKLALPLHSLTR